MSCDGRSLIDSDRIWIQHCASRLRPYPATVEPQDIRGVSGDDFLYLVVGEVLETLPALGITLRIVIHMSIRCREVTPPVVAVVPVRLGVVGAEPQPVFHRRPLRGVRRRGFGGYRWQRERDTVLSSTFPWVHEDRYHYRGNEVVFEPDLLAKLDLAVYERDCHSAAVAEIAASDHIDDRSRPGSGRSPTWR
jgi:hypothetical protein